MTTPIEVERLSEGISEQPQKQRNLGHVQKADNVVVSVASGSSKRHGSVLVDVIAAVDPNGISPNLSGAAYRLHAIERNSDERYLALYGNSTIRVFHEDGTEARITDASAGGAAKAYINAGSADHNRLRLRTFADTTFIINSTVATNDAASASFSIERTRRDYDALVSFTTTVNNYLRTERDSTPEQAGYYRYSIVTYTYAHINFATFTSSAWTQITGNWDDSAKQPLGFKIAFRRVKLAGFTGAAYTAATRTLTKTGAFTGYTFRPGDMVFITSGTGFTATTWYKIESKASNDAIVLSATQPSGGVLPGIDNANTAANATTTAQGDDAGGTCRIGFEIEVLFNGEKELAAAPWRDMNDVALTIQRTMRTAGAENALCAWVPQGSGGNFQITGPYRGNNAFVYDPTASAGVGVGGDLTAIGAPFNPTNRQTFGGTGGAAPDAQDTTIPETRWTRVAAPGQDAAVPDAATMPISLIRTAVGPPADFTIDLIPWNTRTDGDAVSNPIPSFISEKRAVRDLAIHRNRLALLAGNYLFFGQDGDLYNLFAEDAENTIESDPIEVRLGGEQVADGDFVVPFRNAVQVFTLAGRQFDVAGGSDRLSQETVQINPTTRFNTANVRPQTMGNLLYFIGTLEDGAALLEYHFDDLTVSTRTANASIHVPSFIPSSPKTVMAHPATGTVFVLPSAGNTILVYRAHFTEGQKRQSAWTKWMLDPFLTIVDIAILGDRLYLLTVDLGGNNQYVLEYIPIGREDPATNWPYTVHLDRRITVTGSYHAGNNETTFNIAPLQSNGSTINAYVLGPNFAQPGTYSIDNSTWTYDTPPATTIRIPGNLSAGPVTFGRYFRTEIILSRQYRRDEFGRTKSNERLTLVEITTEHENTGEYRVIATRPNGSGHVTVFDAGVGAVAASGFLRALLSCNQDESAVIIRDDSPRPLTISGYVIEADAAEFAR